MARSLWSGTISFGLVSVPVRMVGATESKELRFHFLDKHDLQPIGYDKVRRDTGEHVDGDDIVRGFEVEKGRFVPLEEEDLDRLDVELTKTIEICDFVDLDEIDPIYFRKAYYLEPQEGAETPYRLLVARARGDGQGRDRQGRDPQQAAPRRAAPVERGARARDDVLPRRGAAARARGGGRQAAQGRGRDGEVAGREPERASSTRPSTTTPTARSCSSCCGRRPRASRCRPPRRSRRARSST